MDNAIKVAVVRADHRRGGVAEALALIADELRLCVQNNPHPVIIPNLDNVRRPWTCTHRDTLSATVDALLAAGASTIRIVGNQVLGPRPKGRDPVDPLGYRRELWYRPANFFDIDREANDESWSTISRVDGRGKARTLRIPAWLTTSRCRVCLGAAKTHEIYRVGLGLANLEGVLHPDDRGPFIQRRVTDVLSPYRGSFLKAWLAMRAIAGGMRLTGPERRKLEAVEQATENLISLASHLMPALCLIDGFVAVDGDGPRHGRRIPLRTIIAGTNAVAVDAVAAALLGFEPLEIAYLRLAQASGLGTADLGSISIIGDPLRPARSIRRHSSDRLLRLSQSTRSRTMSPRPHFDVAQTRRSTPAGA